MKSVVTCGRLKELEADLDERLNEVTCDSAFPAEDQEIALMGHEWIELKQALHHLNELRRLAQEHVNKYSPHSGLCCVLVDGHYEVTPESCKCSEDKKAMRRYLAELDGE